MHKYLNQNSGEGIIPLFVGGLPNDTDAGKKMKMASEVGENSVQVCDENGTQVGDMDKMTEPLIPRANNDVSRTQTNDDMYLNNFDHQNTTPTTLEDDENDDNYNYVPLVDDSDGNYPENDDNTNRDDDGQNERYSLDSRRFAILAIFCLNNLIGSAVWITFAPIEDAVKAKFRQHDHTMIAGENSGGISSQQINWLSMISMAVYGPGTAICALVVPKYGFRETVIASSITMALGCFLRWLSLNFVGTDAESESDENSLSMTFYVILLTGQGLVALGQTIFMNAPARVAASWFQQTTKIIGAINLCSSLGIIFQQVLSPLCVTEETGEHLDQLLAAQGVAMGLCAFFTGYWFRYEEPVCPPTVAEAARRKDRQRQDNQSSSSDPTDSSPIIFSSDFEKLLTNPQYIILIVAFGINYGLNSAVMTLIQPWITLLGFPGDKMAGFCGSLLTGGGLIGTWIASILLDFTRNFNQAIRWSFVSATVSAVGLVAALQPDCPTWVLAIAFTITGMTQMPLLTICCDAVAAHTYPVSEELSTAGLQMVGQYLGIFLVGGMSYLIESASNGEDDDNNENKYGFAANVNIAYLSLLGVSTVIALCYHSDDPRAKITNNRDASEYNGSETTLMSGGTTSHDNVSENHSRTIGIGNVDIS